MLIRQETEKEFGQIYELVKIAFQTAQVSNGKEQDFVTKLRDAKYYIPELALVAEENGKLRGHIMLTRAAINNGGKATEILLVAPLSVILEMRGKGIGSALMKESLKLAKAMGYKAVCLVGNPAYYKRFGFRQSSEFGINYIGIPEQYVLTKELVPGTLSGVSGTISHAE